MAVLVDTGSPKVAVWLTGEGYKQLDSANVIRFLSVSYQSSSP